MYVRGRYACSAVFWRNNMPLLPNLFYPTARAELTSESTELGRCTGQPQGPTAPPTALMTRSVCCLPATTISIVLVPPECDNSLRLPIQGDQLTDRLGVFLRYSYGQGFSSRFSTRSSSSVFAWASFARASFFQIPYPVVCPPKHMICDTQVDLDDTPSPTPAPSVPAPTPAPSAGAPTPAPIDPTGVVGPYDGVAAEIPGTVEAEEFDYGGPGVAYSDTDPGNNGGVRHRLMGRWT